MLVALVLLAGCGGGNGSKTARRDAVNAYIQQADAAAAVLVGERGQIDAALRGFSMTNATPGDARRLRGVEAKIRDVARKVRRLTPPPDARGIHTRLLAMLELEATVANHLAWTAEFAPTLSRTLTPVTPAGLALAGELKKAKTWKADAAAYAHYRDALAPIVAALAALKPPPELAPTVARQRRQLSKRTELSAALADAFGKKDVKAVNAGLRGFADLASQDEATRSYLAQVAVTKAYNARLDRISTLAVEIARARQKLVSQLG